MSGVDNNNDTDDERKRRAHVHHYCVSRARKEIPNFLGDNRVENVLNEGRFKLITKQCVDDKVERGQEKEENFMVVCED